METIVLSINGKKIACRPGTSVFEAAEKNGIFIPSLCRHPDLTPHGACRLCLVEDEKSGRLLASCVTPAAREMAVLTDSPRVINHRKNIIRLMMAEHPESCIVCSKGNRCELRRIAAKLGVGENDLYPMPNYQAFEELNPFIVRDLSKCILCGRCIRADQELVCAGAIDYNHRGFASRPATAHEVPLEKSNCTFCGTCVSICPTGALSPKNDRFAGTPESEGLSVCGFCGIGCSLSIGVTDDKIVSINPSGIKDSVNRATLCLRGHFAHDFLNSRGRLTSPMIRNRPENAEAGSSEPSFPEASWEDASWEDALEHVVSRLSDIKRTYGPQSIAFMGSAKCSTEENYLFQKLARAVFGSENIIMAGGGPGRAALMDLDAKTGGRVRTNRLAALENAAAIFVLGPDPDHAAPVLGYHIKRGAKKGAKLIVLNPLPNELTLFASQWIRPQTGKQPNISLAAFLNAISAEMLIRQSHDSRFIDQYTEGFNSWTEHIKGLQPAELARSAGVPESDVATAAGLLKGEKVAFVIGASMLRELSRQSVDALFNLALLTGSLDGNGGGIFLMADGNNWMGACDMGAGPDFLPGRVPLTDETGRQNLENAWKSKISPDPGLGMTELVAAAENGTLKALYIMGENPLRRLPQPDRVARALKKLDFIVVQDIVQNQSTALAEVILPGAAFTEKTGAFTNMEGRIQNFFPLAAPPGKARPDWEILSLLISKMGYPERYETLEQVKQEIRRLVPMYADLGSQQQGWIQNNPAAGGSRMKFASAGLPELPELPDGFPWTAILGQQRFHAGCGTRTSRSGRIQAFDSVGQVEIAADDASRMGVAEKDVIRVTSPYGHIERCCRVNPEMPAGQVFIPLAAHGNDAASLLDLSAPPASDMPGWEACRVKIEKIETKGEMP